jgi:RNA polymerase primary sigma factor
MGSMKEEDINTDTDEEEAESLLDDESEAEDDSTSAEEVEEKEGSGESTAREAEDIKPTVPMGEYEVIDDSARMYLQEIGRVPLLNVHEEKLLCRKIELGRSLEQIEDHHFRKYKKFPSPVDIVIHLISQLPKVYPLVQIVEEFVGIDLSSNVVETIRNPKFRSAIDDVIDPSLIAATAKGIDKGATAAEEAIVNLSINSQLLP